MAARGPARAGLCFQPSAQPCQRPPAPPCIPWLPQVVRGAWPRPQRPVSVSVNQCSRGRGPGPEATNHRREGGVIRVLGQRALNHGKQRWIWAPGGATPSFPPRQMAGWGGGAGPSPSPPSLLGHSRHTASTFRSHARAPRVRPTSIALPGSAGRHSFGFAHERGFLTKGQAWVSQMLPGGKSGVLTEACRAAGASRWHRPPRAPAASRRVLSAARWQATRLHVSPPNSSLWHWGARGAFSPWRRGRERGEHTASGMPAPRPRGDSGGDRRWPVTLSPRAPEPRLG